MSTSQEDMAVGGNEQRLPEANGIPLRHLQGRFESEIVEADDRDRVLAVVL